MSDQMSMFGDEPSDKCPKCSHAVTRHNEFHVCNYPMCRCGHLPERAVTREAIQRADDHADDEWKGLAWKALGNVARTTERFHVDFVWDELARLDPDVTTKENRAMGAIMRRGVKEGLIVGTDQYLPSDRVGCHNHPRRVWKSLVAG